MPFKVNSLFEYMITMRDIVKAEEDCQKEKAMSCVMKDVTVFWQRKVGSDTKTQAYFLPKMSEDDNFKWRLGDELVLYSSNFRKCDLSCRIIKMPTLEDENIWVELINGRVNYKYTYPYQITLKWRGTAYYRMLNALNQLQLIQPDCEKERMVKALLNCHKSENYKILNIFNESDIKLLPSKITPNASQLMSIKMAMRESISIIQGAPGTGKTETCINIIHNMIRQQPQIKILVSAQSNTAVDVLAEKLNNVHIRLIRFFPDRYKVVNSSLKNLGLLETIFKQNEMLRTKYKQFKEKKLTEKDAIEYRQQFDEATQKAWDSVNVICCTCIMSGAKNLKGRNIDVILIDEAAQPIVPETLVPILMHTAKKIILVGDHKQLGPVVLSDEAKDADLEVSLFEKLIEQQNIPSIMLNVQHRMHPTVANFSSELFYDQQVKNGVREDDLLLSFPWLGSRDSALIWFNIIGLERPVGTSYENDVEVKYLVELLKKCIDNKIINPNGISVITPYEGQRRLIYQHFKALTNLKYRASLSEIEVANVDAFQGRENEVIILSCVRANYEMLHGIGFLKDPKRMNVALTRAKRKLILIGNISTLVKDTKYLALYKYTRENGSIINVDSKE